MRSKRYINYRIQSRITYTRKRVTTIREAVVFSFIATFLITVKRLGNFFYLPLQETTSRPTCISGRLLPFTSCEKTQGAN